MYKIGSIIFVFFCALMIAGCGSSSSSPAPENSIIRLFYFIPPGSSKTEEPKAVDGATTTEPPHQIYSALSSDGINFRQESGVRFEWDAITDPDVFQLNDSQYVMFTSLGADIVKATSETVNGTYVEDPLFAWNNGAVSSTVNINGTFVTFYCSGSSGIRYAFYDVNTGALEDKGLALANPFEVDSQICDPTVILLDDGTYIMYYKYAPFGSTGPSQHKIYYATSTDGLNYTDSGILIKDQASVPGAIKVGDTIYLYFVSGLTDSTNVGLSTDNGATFNFQEISVSDSSGTKFWDPNPIPYMNK